MNTYFSIHYSLNLSIEPVRTPELSAVRVVALNVPSSIRRGGEVELSCLYDLGNSSLYSLKWFYRANETDLDEQEFFRYTPSIKPYKQYFPIEGVKVNVSIL